MIYIFILAVLILAYKLSQLFIAWIEEGLIDDEQKYRENFRRIRKILKTKNKNYKI
jgi:hypothetical protein